MLIDPEVSEALAALPPFPSRAGSSITDRRAAADRLRSERGLSLATEDGFTREDRRVPGRPGDSEVPVRLYRPSACDTPLPAVLFFHGGGFSLGDLDVEDSACVRLCTQVGCAVVSVDYRLAPESPYPAALHDGYAALSWLAENSSELGLDPMRIAVAGGSAGGGLAAAVALFARDHQGPPIRFQVLIYPEIDDRMDNTSSNFLDVPIFDGAAKRVSYQDYLGQLSGVTPIYAAPNRCENLAGLPPALIVTAALDPLRDEGLAYAAKLLAADVSVELHHFPDVPHGWDIFAPATSSAQRSWADRIACLRRAFGVAAPSPAM